MTGSPSVDSSPAIALVHPCRLFSEGLASILRDTPYKLVFQGAAFEAASVERLLLHSGLVFLVGGQTAAQVERIIKAIRSRLHLAHILVLGTPIELDEVMAALKAGADGYLRETTTSGTLITAIELLLRGETMLPTQFLKALPSISGVRTDAAALEPEVTKNTIVDNNELVICKKPLSTREEAILQSLVDGAPNKVIAQKLSITEATVKLHVKAILRKIRVKNRTQAAIWAARNLPQNGPLSMNESYPVRATAMETAERSERGR